MSLPALRSAAYDPGMAQPQVTSDPMQDLARRLSELAGAPVQIGRPTDPSHGDVATNVALRLAGQLRRPPREVAQELANHAADLPDVDRAEVAGPGFLNLFLADAWFRHTLDEALSAGDAYGAGSAAPPERVQVEMVSANPTGPITVAAARNGAYGDSVARLLSFAGHTVEREYYYNDAGAQMDRFRASVEAARRGEDPPEDGYHGDYITDLAAVAGDPVPRMRAQIEAALERFRIHFDSWVRQSVVEARLPELLPRLDSYEKDGAVWARSGAYGDDDDRVLIRSATGLPTYRAADVPYLVDKLERGFDRAIYVLGADHHSTAKWYPAIARMLGYDADRIEVLLYQFVHLTGAGETTKMSKRAGNVVMLDDLVDEIGVDAERWYLVSRGHDQTIEIDVDLASERTAKNPVYYVQYAHARIAGILRNAQADTVAPSHEHASPSPLAGEERDLVKRLAEFPGVVAGATARRTPHAIPNYAIRLADDFHRFYHHHKVLGSAEEELRLGLCRATRSVVARSLDLIGVEAPERM